MKMLTLEQVRAMVEELEVEYGKTQFVPHYYKRNGKMVERSFPDVVYTERYEELFYDREEKGLRGECGKIFRCTECGEMFGYFDIEHWYGDSLDSTEQICSCCYEEMMGEDL